MAQETDPEKGLQPVAVGKDAGDARWWFGSLAVIKAAAADTGGQMVDHRGHGAARRRGAAARPSPGG